MICERGEPGLKFALVRYTNGVSPDAGLVTADLEPYELVSLIDMYGTAISELAATEDPGVGGLAEELLTLRADALSTLARLGPSGRNGHSRLH